MRKPSGAAGSLLRRGEFVTKSFGVGERRTSRVLDGVVEIGATAIRCREQTLEETEILHGIVSTISRPEL